MWEGGTAGPEWAKRTLPTLLGRIWNPQRLPHYLYGSLSHPPPLPRQNSLALPSLIKMQ